MARGGDPKVILTGYDTIQTLGELLQAQERFMGRSVPTHSGIKGVEGREVGFRVATYHDIPIIPVKDMPTGGAGLSDILILDMDHFVPMHSKSPPSISKAVLTLTCSVTANSDTVDFTAPLRKPCVLTSVITRFLTL